MWWADGSRGIRQGIEFYDAATGPIEQEFNAIEARVKSRSPHCLDASDLSLIVQFKLWPGMRRWAGGKVMEGPPPEQLTAWALKQARDGEMPGALLTLSALPRVGVPTASAILAAVYPELFAVIDRYVMAEVGHLAAASITQGTPADQPLGLLVDSLSKWAGESWASVGAGGLAYEPFVMGLRLKTQSIGRAEGEAFRPRDIEKAMYGHFLRRTGRRVL